MRRDAVLGLSHWATLTSAALALLLGACGARTEIAAHRTHRGSTSGGPDYQDCGPPEGPCQTRSCAPPKRTGTHVPICSHIDFASNPPTSGPHYPIWAAYKIYDQPIPRGFYLHDEEHSAVVLLYNCALFEGKGGCKAMVDEITAAVAASEQDPMCSPPVKNRLVVVPDPALDVPFAAAAWGYSLKGRCFDVAMVKSFIAAHYGMNYENFCSDGIDPTDPTNKIPADCGQ